MTATGVVTGRHTQGAQCQDSDGRHAPLAQPLSLQYARAPPDIDVSHDARRARVFPVGLLHRLEVHGEAEFLSGMKHCAIRILWDTLFGQRKFIDT
jgi:hypothetical protein